MQQPYSKYLLRHIRLIIGQKIHHFRKEKRWSLNRLSILTDIPEWQLDHYEIGKSDINLIHLLRIVCVFGVEIREFV